MTKKVKLTVAGEARIMNYEGIQEKESSRVLKKGEKKTNAWTRRERLWICSLAYVCIELLLFSTFDHARSLRLRCFPGELVVFVGPILRYVSLKFANYI